MKKGGIKKPLGDVFETVTGNTPSKSNAEYYGRHLPLVKPPELQDCELSEAEDGLSEEGARVARVAPPSSILVSCIGNLGKIGFNTVPVAFNQQINAIIPNRSLAIPEFFFYQVLSCRFRNQLESLASGTTVSIVNKSRFNSIEIVLPPLSEQQRIVGVLDEAFASLATAQAHAAQNLQNARALFESHLQAVFTQRGPGWVEKPFSALCDIKHGFAFKGEFFTSQGHYVLLTPGNFFESGGYRDRGEKQKYYSGDFPPEYITRQGDMLVAMTEQAAGLLGSPLLVPEDGKFLHNQRLGLVISKPGVPWLNEFFFHVFNTKVVRDAIHASASGVKVRHTSPGKIGDVVVSFPTSVKEQRAIVTQLDALSAETQRLTSLYERKLAALEALKKALLHQAFAGEL
jgi:type I restriction enzyme S subunit